MIMRAVFFLVLVATSCGYKKTQSEIEFSNTDVNIQYVQMTDEGMTPTTLQAYKNSKPDELFLMLQLYPKNRLKTILLESGVKPNSDSDLKSEILYKLRYSNQNNISLYSGNNKIPCSIYFMEESGQPGKSLSLFCGFKLHSDNSFNEDQLELELNDESIFGEIIRIKLI